MNDPRRCVHCPTKTVLTCTDCINALCSYCQEEHKRCPRCRIATQNTILPSSIGSYGLTFARLAEEGQRYYASSRGGN